MTNIGKHYRQLQFYKRLYEYNATEFQCFFENVMEILEPEFQKIWPYGNKGDGGNDGYLPSKGIYYQVYAPKYPSEKTAKAAEKMTADFNKLKAKWNNISKINTFIFVFNDKRKGSTIDLEENLKLLKTENPNIEFALLLNKDFEKEFSKLTEDELISLGFNTDRSEAEILVAELFEMFEVELDKDNCQYVLQSLNNFKEIIVGLKNEETLLNYHLFYARTLGKLENNTEAKALYENICIKYPKDIRAYLYLAEYYLSINKFEDNLVFLEKAKHIDDKHWLLILEWLIRDLRLENQIDLSQINEALFPTNNRIRSAYYRIYSLVLARSGNQERAISFIERAISLNPSRTSNYETKLGIIEEELFQNISQREDANVKLMQYLKEIDLVDKNIASQSEIGDRLKAIISIKKLNTYYFLGEYEKAEAQAEISLEFLFNCFFDEQVNRLFIMVLIKICVPDSSLSRLSRYLETAQMRISDTLAKAIIFQFAMRSKLISEGNIFFKIINNESVCDFLINLEGDNYVKTWNFIKDDNIIILNYALAMKEKPGFRKYIIESLPEEIKKEQSKLLMLLYFDEGDFDAAFKILMEMDFSGLHHLECVEVLKIAEKKEAWDYVVSLVQKLLAYEKDNYKALGLLVLAFNANNHLGNYIEAFKIGTSILTDTEKMKYLDEKNGEALLGQCIRGLVIRGEYEKAQNTLREHKHLAKTYEFKIAIEADLFLKCKDYQQAIDSIVQGVKILGYPKPEQYGLLYIMAIEILNKMPELQSPLETAVDNSYVKIKNQEKWYYLGNDCELDATKYQSIDQNYKQYIGKKIGEKIVFKYEFASKDEEIEIENILDIERYILYRSVHIAHEMTEQHRWNKMELIEIPTTAEGIDPKYLIARLQQIQNSGEEIYSIYLKEAIPLAYLASTFGGIVGAIGKISNENRGFIHTSKGDIEEARIQDSVARKILAGEPFYIDGLSALLLAESGMLKEIHRDIPQVKVPQSVINFLFAVKEKIESSSNSIGFMAVSQGRLRIEPVDEKKNSFLAAQILNGINLLESNRNAIIPISQAVKARVFSEQNIPPELCDACILAQIEGIPILTDDFLFLYADNYETGKHIPQYCSSYILLKAMYEAKAITFEQYIGYYYYLASYRIRFLPVGVQELEKAIFGDGQITILKPENIRLFNLRLTLSVEYGVSYENAFRVVCLFIIKVLLDDSILPEIAIRIYSELILSFPIKWNKKIVGIQILRKSEEVIKSTYSHLILNKRIKEKIDSLTELLDVYSGKEMLIL
jgi:hypothetical protein